MCVPPQVALVAISAGSSFLQYQQQKQLQKDQMAQQVRQNEIARKNALQRYASEQLKIRQVAKQSSQKGLEATLKARKARAEFVTTAGSSGIALSGSTNALLADFYRTESNYKASLARNLEAIQFGQESQSTYVQPPNPTLLFASAVGNVANTYYGIEMQKQNMGLMTNYEKRQLKKNQNQVIETYA